MYGVHLDVGVLEFRCQMDREHVDGCFRCVIGEFPQGRDGARLHCLKRQRAEDACEVTIRPASLFFSRGRSSRVRATRENTLVLKMLWSSLSVDALARRPMRPSAGPMPLLLTKISSLPWRDSMNF